MAGNQKPHVTPFFDEDTNTFSYVVKDPSSASCAIVDSVLNFDYASGAVSYAGADSIIDYVRKNNLKLEWLIETHVHADHLTAAPYIQEKLGGKLGIGEHILTVQETFGSIFNEGSEFRRDGSQFDRLFKDGEDYQVGELHCKAIHTPGHTPACMTHVMGDAAFVGDTLFMPDLGTARADFPGGDAGVLYDSIQKILSLPDETRIFMCHDYPPETRGLEYLTSVEEEKGGNIHVKSGIGKSVFVEMRQARDSGLEMPRLILPSLQVNMRAGHFPEAETNGTVYLKVPVNAFD
ncbi:MBL fold metallo-hydrolase [Microbulbifer pacificus]|uniref:MBL fold metallo-hydrolase n=1 Tax=Microbulbifer pacificus TaxID=407164 RepID=A0AAU0MVD1_9GAMM|nr:MBL fold metallo-hydrolase [Microbulbifer pacificus]WOX04596.1 MBL fold metallo-hydrolase [Microbulbifer pacificus]